MTRSGGLSIGKRSTRAAGARARRRGMVLILVLVVIAALSLAALTFSELMLTERQAAEVSCRQVQAQVLAQSGVEMTRLFLAGDRQTQYDSGGWYDNPTLFRGVLVVDDQEPRWRGRFTLLAPQVQEGLYGGVRFGLEDESGRLNLNTLLYFEKEAEKAGIQNAGRLMLMGLPGMTEDVADAILDWIDPDDEPREFGAELQEYVLLDPPYAPKNDYLETIEELLLVRGVTPVMLFGTDANRNGYPDAGELDPMLIPNVDNSDGSMNRGWAAYLTLSSLESNLRSDGQPKINLNQSDMNTLYQELQEALMEVDEETAGQWAEFIVLYRQYGPYQEGGQQEQPEGENQQQDPFAASPDTGRDQGQSTLATQPIRPSPAPPSNSGAGPGPSSGQPSSGSDRDSQGEGAPTTPGGPDASKQGEFPLQTVLDLIGAQVGVPVEGEENATVPRDSPFLNDPEAMREYLPLLMEYTTTVDRELIPGRINVNQAPQAVLATIPGMTGDVLEQIIFGRQPDPLQTESGGGEVTWLLIEGIVPLEQMKQMMPFITGGGSMYRGQVFGYYEQEGPTARVEVILDATTRPARVISWTDLSHLGAGYSVEILGAEAAGL